MKPKISVVFPQFVNESFSDIGVEKIKISRTNRSMSLILENQINDGGAKILSEGIKTGFNLKNVAVTVKEHMSAVKKIMRNMALEQNDDINSGEEQKTLSEVLSAGIKSKPKDAAKTFLAKSEKGDVIYGSVINGEPAQISSINENSGKVVFCGRVFNQEFKDIKKGEMHLGILDITDYKDSITVKFFIKNMSDEDYKELQGIFKDGVKKKNLYVCVRGRAEMDSYANEITVIANAIMRTKDPRPKREDKAPKKRVELHLHTQMSTMDGVSSASALIKRAIEFGHTAMAITDHGVAQSYPEAMHETNNSETIKIIYGVEGYLVDDSKKIVYNESNENINSDFVVFDIETTGLSKEKNHITEIGAVKISGGKVTERWSTFVNPREKIPYNIVKLTGITDDMVKDAPYIEDIFDEFADFCKGCVMVAHNADFDMGFMKTAAERMGKHFDLPYLDTLMLARVLYPDFSNHKLGNLSKQLKVVLENHHRAVNDAKATADIFIKMTDELRLRGICELNKLNESFDLANAAKRNKAYHIILLAKNQIGLRHIYELISESHLKYMLRNPRIPRSVLKAKREGIIIGSACEAGEVFRAVLDKKSDEELEKIIDFYDYLEIQPIGNNAFLKRDNEYPEIQTDEDLQNLNRRIVELGDKFGKKTAATCDVHFMDKDDAQFRTILMYYKGFKDAAQQAPLYFRTTEEMLEEFAYLGKERAYEVVVENTNLISDMIDKVRPIPTEKCPPEIEGAQEDIINDSHRKAEEIYGNPLPDLVKERLDKELHSITTYGFSVMYKIAQELVRKSLSDGYLVGSRGSVGSSFVAFLSDITEVNSLPPHYICPNCKNSEFIDDDSGLSGCDLPDKICPKCGTPYKKDGHNIPFETFLGFKGDKEPDIDLNFSGEYQPVVHKYTEELFGEGYVFRAGTIGTVAEKTALGYVRKFVEENNVIIKGAHMRWLAQGCVGVKRTTGQHPGGIIVVPHKNNIHEFCPVQHPADSPDSDIVTTHFDYHSIDQNLLKLDELGHDAPTAIKMLSDLTGIDPLTIPLDDKETMSLFTSTKALKLQGDIGSTVGTYGVPEYGTKFVRQMLLDTKPHTFSELVRISGLSHGTDVWLNNAQDLIRAGTTTLSKAICTRDDIMIYLIYMGVDAGHAFKIMESVRKGKGLKPEDEDAMKKANVPDWYIASCKKIKYMFPKAHAVAYLMMAFRIAYFKVHYPAEFYISYFSVSADDFDYDLMAQGADKAKAVMSDILERDKNGQASPKEKNLIPILEICIEMYMRDLSFEKIDLYKSDAVNFSKTEDGKIRPPLNAFSGLPDNAARDIVNARKDGEFVTVDDFKKRTDATKTVVEILQKNHCFDGIPESNQISFFDMI